MKNVLCHKFTLVQPVVATMEEAHAEIQRWADEVCTVEVLDHRQRVRRTLFAHTSPDGNFRGKDRVSGHDMVVTCYPVLNERAYAQPFLFRKANEEVCWSLVADLPPGTDAHKKQVPWTCLVVFPRSHEQAWKAEQERQAARARARLAKKKRGKK